ncbi:uncharacterized protein BT62DRAFT_602194 [Guyanagaster necrorhizus]|uniref:Uncharacterized protein n=1 Tax=Guyanagaster necrorhizus TaxID=856835 RepID=A0A9P7W1K3_9AGAR|nr:uncharacterized protein BT62DRAFT_602194 [Guyanagaster necrorhizus MCA 3950]KAG7449696.1 hypothetical protein BT62DRAFT_602194 [Guyanagaster necrorhizus MCA 3950]
MGTWNLGLVIFKRPVRLDALSIYSTQVMRAAGHPPQRSQCLFLLCGVLCTTLSLSLLWFAL